jgi:NAD(P)-dependent dehydrogenase (short-subunit alcohol dehydrogenase family)
MPFNAKYNDLKGKVVIVAGANGLLGKKCVDGFITQESMVIGIDSESSKTKEVENYIHFFCDLTKINETEKTISSIISKYKKIYAMVNTAYPRTKDWGRSFIDEDIKYFNSNVNMQLGSTYQITKLLADIMKENNEGSIINYGSTYGILANNVNIYKRSVIEPSITYNSIKGGVANLTRAFASYYGKYNLRINSICPGGIYNNHQKDFVEDFSALTPLNRMGRPNEIAEASVFLSSNSASYITGQNILVDGGWSAW